LVTLRPLSLRCRVPSVRAPGLDLHLLVVCHAERTPRQAYGLPTAEGRLSGELPL
jgi:hypothetical protein